ncbi:MAG: carboxypeptidase-like regulatory domain-containing protein, partial [Bacteroidota bacterium]|nr:carboxypeptidase-like regulatory domain-containing protein [Bacteroidota bacterium]
MKKHCQPAYKRESIRFLLSFLLLFLFGAAKAQSVTGTVLDPDNKPVNGATVTVKGTSKATLTNAAGIFNIDAAGSDIIVVSHIGFATIEVPLNGRSKIFVSLVRGDGKDLDVVLVTALGIKRHERRLGYAVTSVNTDELVANRTTNIGESLEGKVAGLNITPPAAGAGSSIQIRLRGQVGFAGSTNSPLLVINGLPMDQGVRNTEGAGQQRDQGDNLQVVNPD